MLKLPQQTLTTASLFMQRFMMRRSFVSGKGGRALHHYEIAATSLFLATKVEESCRRVREIIIACCRTAQRNPS